jgi:hypothetical protein
MGPPKNRNPGALAGAHGADRGDTLSSHSSTLNRHRLQHLARTIHRLGPRALYELLLEMIEGPTVDFLDRFEIYAQLDAAQLRVTGGDRFPPAIFAAGDGR